MVSINRARTTRADDIRKFVIDRYVNPARNRGKTELTIHAGTVSNEMRVSLTEVCQALRGRIFAMVASVILIREDTPPSGGGANAWYTYRL